MMLPVILLSTEGHGFSRHSPQGLLHPSPSPEQCFVQGTEWKAFLVSQTLRDHFMWSTRTSDFLWDLSFTLSPRRQDLHEEIANSEGVG